MVLSAQRWTNGLRDKKRSACVAFEAGPEEAWRLEEHEGSLRHLEAEDVRLLTLQPWHADAIQKWLAEGGSALAEERRRVVEMTGSWPFLLQRLQDTSAVNLRSAIESFTPLLEAPELGGSFLEALGVPDKGRRRDVLLRLALAEDDEGSTPEHLAAPDAGQPLAFVERVLRWADRLAFARPLRHGRWRLDGVVAQALLGVYLAEDA